MIKLLAAITGGGGGDDSGDGGGGWDFWCEFGTFGGGWLQKLPNERTTGAKSEEDMRSGHR